MTPDEWKEIQRPAFEAWALIRYCPKFLKRNRGGYLHAPVRDAWTVWLAAKAEPVEVTEERVERASRAFHPELFSENHHEAHRAASPIKLEVARKACRVTMRHILTAALAGELPDV